MNKHCRKFINRQLVPVLVVIGVFVTAGICALGRVQDFDRTIAARTHTSVLSVSVTSVEGVYFSPSTETETGLITYINGAKDTLDIAIYSLTNKKIADAILSAKKRKVAIRVVVDKAQAGGKNSLWKVVGGKIDKKSGLMHNKFIVRDDACVSTGSFNFTENAVKNNRENLIILCDKQVAQKFSDEFDKIWRNNT